MIALFSFVHGLDWGSLLGSIEVVWGYSLPTPSHDLLGMVHTGSVVLAQKLDTPDFGAQIASAWHNFVESGQIWAAIIGFFFGWLIKNFTG